MNPSSAPAIGPTLDAWDVIDQWIDELTRLAREPMSPPAFYAELLRRLVEAVAAGRATVWECESQWTVAKTAIGEFDPAAKVVAQQTLAARARIIAWATSRGEPCALMPGASPIGNDGLVNPTDCVLLVCTWSIDGAARGALEIEQRASTSPEARQGALRLLTTFAEIAADYQRNQQRIDWKDRATAGAELDGVLTSIYADADLQATAYAIANEGRRWIGADRVSVVRFDGKRSRTLAVSGVDAIDRRADCVQKLERLATAVAASRTDLAPDAIAESRLPQVERALAEYIEVAEPREVAALLLREPRYALRSKSEQKPEPVEDDGRIVGLLVFEQFTGASLDEVARARTVILQRHGSAAIAHATDLENIPLGRVWRRFAKHRTERRQRWTKIGIASAIVVVLLAVPFFIPAPFTIEARGTLEPRERRDLFAPTSGIVSDVLVEHGEAVKQGQTLVVLRKPELEVESARLLGELQTAERRLAALRANRTTAIPTDAAARRHQQELLGEEEQLQVRLSSLRLEQGLLAAQEKELQVTAPSDGSITTWDARRLLSGKPVERGHSLVSVAELNGPWVLELRVPDRRFAEIAEARAVLGDRLEVEFIAAADPQTEFTGHLVRLADTARTDARHGTTIAATVEIGDGRTRDELIRDELRRPGASVIAKIHCGTRSLGSIWTSDFLHYLRTRWFF